MFDPGNSGAMLRTDLRTVLVAVGVDAEVADAAMNTVSKPEDRVVNYKTFVKLAWRAGASQTVRDGLNVIDVTALRALDEVSFEAGEALLSCMLLCLWDPSAYILQAVDLLKRELPEAMQHGLGLPTCVKVAIARAEGELLRACIVDDAAWHSLEELSAQTEIVVLNRLLMCRRNPSEFIVDSVQTLKRGQPPGVSLIAVFDEPPRKRPRG